MSAIMLCVMSMFGVLCVFVCARECSTGSVCVCVCVFCVRVYVRVLTCARVALRLLWAGLTVAAV